MDREKRKYRVHLLELILPLTDFIIIASCFFLALWLRFTSGVHETEQPMRIHQVRFYTLLVMSALWIAIFQVQRLYHARVIVTLVRQGTQIIKGVTIGTLIYIFLSYLLKSAYMEQSRLVIGYSWIFSFVALSLFRCGIFRFLYIYIGKETIARNVLIVGAGKKGKLLTEKIRDNRKIGIRIVGYIDDDSLKKNTQVGNIPVLGTVDEINLIVHDHGIDEIYIAIDAIDHHSLLGISSRCREAKVPVQIMSDIYAVITSKVDVENFDGIPMVEIKDRYVEDFNIALKRLSDVCFAATGLIILAPVLLLLALLVKLSSPGGVLFRQERVGKNGRHFSFYKFRTMLTNNDDREHRAFLQEYINSDEKSSTKKVFKMTTDARITKMGSFLRKTSLDELPQLLNVLKGDMSLVGPRPCLPYEFEQYKPWHKRRFNVLPGITGLWQVSGRSTVAFNDMVMLDLYYIENMSLWFDFQILIKTIPVVFMSSGGH